MQGVFEKIFHPIFPGVLGIFGELEGRYNIECKQAGQAQMLWGAAPFFTLALLPYAQVL